MVSPTTTQMSKWFNTVKVLHLETTTVCNAACPQCQRENPNFYIDHRDRNELTLDQCQSMFNLEFIEQLEKMLA